jgi:REP element-mobilizing transposase RayT
MQSEDPRKLRHVVMLTLHAYASWLPNRPQGYFRNHDGLRQQDADEADRYRRRQREDEVVFEGDVQKQLLDELLSASVFQSITPISVAIDPQHVHILLGWYDNRSPEQVQRSLKRSMTLHLNQHFGKRQWFTRNGHDRRVRDRNHFEHLRWTYLPSHRGWCWDRATGFREPF